MSDNDDFIVDWSDEAEPLPEAEDQPWKILIVDDDPDVHASTKFAFTGIKINQHGIEWYDSYTGKECVEFLESHHEIDLIILDVVMETPNAGLAAAKKIREFSEKKGVPVIILRSGQAGQLTDHELANNPDINTFIPKSKATREVLKSLMESYLTCK